MPAGINAVATHAETPVCRTNQHVRIVIVCV